jgi:hypothetical protein
MGSGVSGEEFGLVAGRGLSGPRHMGPGTAGDGAPLDPDDLVMGAPPALAGTTAPTSPPNDGDVAAAIGAPNPEKPLASSIARAGPGEGRGALGRGLLTLGSGLRRRLPSELVVARVMVPALVATVLASLASPGAAKVSAGIWALALVLSITARMSATDNEETLCASCLYWSAFGLACTAPEDAAVAVGAGLLVWTSARPGHEWLPWPMLYRRLARIHTPLLDKVATTAVAAVPAAAFCGSLILWFVPSVGKGFAWFAGFGLAALLLLALTTAGKVVTATRAVGRVALVLVVFSFASISDVRPALVGATALLGVVLSVLEPRRPPSIERAA